MNKKAIAILGAIFLLIVGTLGFLIFSKYFSGETANTVNTNPTPTITGTEPTPTPEVDVNQNNGAKVVLLSSDQVISPVLFYKGNGVDYFDPQGNLIQAEILDNNGQLSLTSKKQLAIPPKAGIKKVLWPSQTQDFIVQFKDASGQMLYSYFNYDTGMYTDLPPQVTSLSWMPNGKQIMYVWVENGKASLSIADPNTKNYTKLTDMWELDNEIHVAPDGSQILYFQTENNALNNNINSVSIDGKVFKGLVKSGQNYGVLWSPDSQKFLFAKKDSATQIYSLWVYNLTSGEVRNTNLSTTVDKAVWDTTSNFVYAAVPNNPVVDTKALTIDTFYKIDISNYEKKPFETKDFGSIDGRDLIINITGDKLLFRNAQDGGLYYLDLTQ